MIVINEIPDMEEDRAAGKLTLVARYGKKAGAKLYVASWVCTYAVIIGSVAFRILPLYTLFALFSLPLVYRSIRILRENYDDPRRMAPANLDMIKAHSITSLRFNRRLRNPRALKQGRRISIIIYLSAACNRLCASSMDAP